MKLWPHGLHSLWARSFPDDHDPAGYRKASDLDGSEIRLLIQFISEVGAAMNAAGEATTFIRRTLQRIGRAYGLENLGVFVVPTLLLLRYGDGRSTFVDLTSRIPADLRLDQTAALYQLIHRAQLAGVSAQEGLTQLRELLATRTRFPAYLRIPAVTLIAGGVLLTLEPSLSELLLAGGLALLVGLVSYIGQRWPQLWPLIPPAAGLVVGVVAFLAIDLGVECRPLRVIVPPLAVFLPGAALTVSMIELSNGDILAGGGRLAYGVVRLFLLVFGVVVGAQWIGLGEQIISVSALQGYVALMGLVVFTLGVYVYSSAPPGSFIWLLIVVAAAWGGKQFGDLLIEGSLGGFVGGASMIVVARAISSYRSGPPLIVSVTPAFWLLVPGAIGLEGLSKIAQENPLAGIDDLVAMVVTMVAIALGVLFGLLVTGSERAREPG